MDLKLTYEGYEGEVVVKVASNIERLEVMESLGIDIVKLSKSDEDKESTTGDFMTMKNIISLLKISQSHYSKVELKRLSDEKEFKSFDDLNSDPACQHILMDAATKCLLGLGDSETKK